MSENEILAMTLKLLREACKTRGADIDITPSTRLGELAFDSMILIEIIYQLEVAFGMDADESLLAELETVGDIVNLLKTSPPRLQSA